MTSSEADARIVIDELLRQAQWDPADKSQVRTEVTVQDLEKRIGQWFFNGSQLREVIGRDRRRAPGSSSYVLLEWTSSRGSESKSVPLNLSSQAASPSLCPEVVRRLSSDQRRVDLFLGLSK